MTSIANKLLKTMNDSDHIAMLAALSAEKRISNHFAQYEVEFPDHSKVAIKNNIYHFIESDNTTIDTKSAPLNTTLTRYTKSPSDWLIPIATYLHHGYNENAPMNNIYQAALYNLPEIQDLGINISGLMTEQQLLEIFPNTDHDSIIGIELNTDEGTDFIRLNESNLPDYLEQIIEEVNRHTKVIRTQRNKVPIAVSAQSLYMCAELLDSEWQLLTDCIDHDFICRNAHRICALFKPVI